MTTLREAAQQALAEPQPVAYRYSVQPQVIGPSVWAFSETNDSGDAQPLYTAPPQRKPLTEEEIQELSQQHKFYSLMEKFVRIIEQAHGIGVQR